MNERCAYSIPDFCSAHGISRTQFYNLLKQKNGPDIMKIGKRTLISVEAAERWREKVTKQSQRAFAEERHA